jgi:hypothetical protein
LGIKIVEASKKKLVGRPQLVDLIRLIEFEGIWVEQLYCLKHGQQEIKTHSYGASGMIVRAHGDRETYYDASSGTAREQKGRESIITQIAGEAPKMIRQPRIIESDDHRKNWDERAKSIEEMTQRILMGSEPRKGIVRAKPDEKHLWDALKKAKTGAQVRKIVKSSRIWLIWRIEFPKGGFMDWGWTGVPKALFDHADQFCKAKLDPRYPGRDKRELADYWRMEYMARVLAGFSLVKPISPSYSVEILRKIKHPEDCSCWRCTLEISPRFPRTLAQHLCERAQKEKTIATLAERQ